MPVLWRAAGVCDCDDNLDVSLTTPLKRIEPVSTPLIRLLEPADAAPYVALRLRGLQAYPRAFTSSLEEEAQRPLSWAESRLALSPGREHDFFLGAFVQDRLVGLVGLEGKYRPKERHIASVVGMLVAPEFAGRGLGAALMHGLLERARQLPALEQLVLTVTEGNPRAQGLYERCGFTVYGVLPAAVKVDGQDHAKVMMVCRLKLGA